jgi:hypothetical protein
MNDAKARSVQVKMTVEEMNRLQGYASESRLSMAEIMRSAIPGSPEPKRCSLQISLSEQDREKLEWLAQGAGLTIHQVVGALVHQAVTVTLYPGRALPFDNN